MIGVKEAVTAARAFALQLLGAERALDLTLEEVELTGDERYWLVTFGFPAQAGPFAALSNPRLARDYKIFRVNAENGSVQSMKIREAA